MKRILFFLLLLVNLQLTTDNGSLSIEFGEVSAQRLMEAQLSKEVTRGWGDQWQCPYCKNWFYGYSSEDCQKHIYYECEDYNTKCPQCKELIPYDKISWHMNNECRFRKVKCPKCDEDCYAYEIEWGSHVCTFHCMCCGSPLGYGESCVCGCDLEAIGEEPWWMKYGYPGEGGITGGRFDGGDISGGNGNNGASQSGQNSNQKKNSDLPHSRIDMRMLKSLPGFTLIPNLPYRLHIQPKETHECVPRAIAFMLELKNPKGFNYDKVLEDLKTQAKEKEGINVANKGIPFVPSHFIENLYSNYGVEGLPLSESAIINNIKKGIPVAIGILEPKPEDNHMVTVIGYDSEYIYVAAGNPEGSANMIPRADLKNKRSSFSPCLYIIK